jgi:hypothetical protein
LGDDFDQLAMQILEEQRPDGGFTMDGSALALLQTVAGCRITGMFECSFFAALNRCKLKHQPFSQVTRGDMKVVQKIEDMQTDHLLEMQTVFFHLAVPSELEEWSPLPLEVIWIIRDYVKPLVDAQSEFADLDLELDED